MNRNQYAKMMQDIHETRIAGGDVAACITKYREMYKYVYVYNDSCFKKIFGAIENRGLAASFLNAILNLEGPRCIGKLDFVDPSVPGGPFVKSVTSDLVAGSRQEPHCYRGSAQGKFDLQGSPCFLYSLPHFAEQGSWRHLYPAPCGLHCPPDVRCVFR